MQAKIQFNCVISPYPAQKIVNLPLFKMNMELKEHFNNKIFKLISETADELGVECYVVGGYVRDIFLARPSKDIDVVVVGSGIEMAQAFGKKLGRGAHVSVFKNFGTAQVKYHDTEVEFVGARKESYSHDSRKPVVEDGTLEDDQNRRDFTINAMAVCLNKARFGELVDPFNGLDDLKERTIRTPLDPDITFSDDPLRMMRCVRFATQLNFYIDDTTFEALSRNKERIHIISKERIADELNKILLAPIPSKGFISISLAESCTPETNPIIESLNTSIRIAAEAPNPANSDNGDLSIRILTTTIAPTNQSITWTVCNIPFKGRSRSCSFSLYTA